MTFFRCSPNQSRSKSNSYSCKTRISRFENLEQRTLLTATSICSHVYSDSISAAQYEKPEVTSREYQNNESSIPIKLDENFDIDYQLMEAGSVQVLGQAGIQKITSMSYCQIPDEIYLDLWEQAISRWEEVIDSGVEDVVYPYSNTAGEEIQIDDILLYMGFSDSFSSSSSLGSALNAGYYRDQGRGIAATGSLVFNAKYFTKTPSETVQKVFYNTALHEVAHALGYNVTHLKKLGLVEESAEIPFGLDSIFTEPSSYIYYVGANGVLQYQNEFSEEFLSFSPLPESFPMETYTASGSFGAHLSSALGTYYLYLNQRDGMTYSISPSYKATITPITLGIMQDLGFSINYGQADPIGSPVPLDLTTVPQGASVLLNWTSPNNIYTSSTSSACQYQIERLDLTLQPNDSLSSQESWSVIASGVASTSFTDVTIEPGHEYSYRVKALNLSTNVEVGVFRAQEGTLLEWDSEESRFSIYALTSKGSGLLTWTKVVSSTDQHCWTAPSLSSSPENGSTLYRVIALGAPLEYSEYSTISTVAVSTRAHSYIPSGYDKGDWNAIREFLELKDELGIKNGVRILGSQYSSSSMENIPGLTWTSINGIYYVTDINWNSYGLKGELSLSTLNYLTNLDVGNNQISSISLPTISLTSLDVSHNCLETIDLSKIYKLETCKCNDNALSSLELSDNSKLVYFDCSNNFIDQLDLSAVVQLSILRTSNNPIKSLSCTSLSRINHLDIWNPLLAEVWLPTGFVGNLDVSSSASDSYEWIRESQILTTAPSYTFDGVDVSIELTLLANQQAQKIAFFPGNAQERPETPTDLTIDQYENGNLIISWTDHSNNEIGYKIYRQNSSGHWQLIDSVPSSSETSKRIQYCIKGVTLSSALSIKVCGYRLDSRGEEIESVPVFGEFLAKEASIEGPRSLQASQYDVDQLNLHLSWDSEYGAKFYEVQYRYTSIGLDSWSTPWTQAEILNENSRIAYLVRENRLYEFRVRSYFADGTASGWSNCFFSTAAQLSSPSGFIASGFSTLAQTLELRWNASESADYYEIQYRISNSQGETWLPWSVADNRCYTTSRVASRVQINYNYEFRVRARSHSGTFSDWSTISFSYVDDYLKTMHDGDSNLFVSY